MKIKNKNGITLIALVITVIILLILAGTAISIAINGGDLFGKTNQAATSWNRAVGEEENALQNLLGKLTGEGTGITPTEPTEPETGLSASNISSAASSYYGKTVNYSANNITDWKILYADNSNIYLIASYYVANTILPTSPAGMSTGGIYSISWWNAPNPAQSPILALNSWNTWNDYSSYDNAKCVSTLLKTSNWENFVNDYAEYAIGGPTIEMLVASINEKYPNECQLTTATNAYGFGICSPNSNTYNSLDFSNNKGFYIDLTNKTLSDQSTGVNHASYGNGSNVDSLYFPYTTTYENCNGYFLASPSADTSEAGERIMTVVATGGIRYHSYWDPDSVGIRPVVCLKSNVELVEGSGVYDFDIDDI